MLYVATFITDAAYGTFLVGNLVFVTNEMRLRMYPYAIVIILLFRILFVKLKIYNHNSFLTGNA